MFTHTEEKSFPTPEILLLDYFAIHATEEDIKHNQGPWQKDYTNTENESIILRKYGNSNLIPTYSREEARYRYAQKMINARNKRLQADQL